MLRQPRSCTEHTFDITATITVLVPELVELGLQPAIRFLLHTYCSAHGQHAYSDVDQV